MQLAWKYRLAPCRDTAEILHTPLCAVQMQSCMAKALFELLRGSYGGSIIVDLKHSNSALATLDCISTAHRNHYNIAAASRLSANQCQATQDCSEQLTYDATCESPMPCQDTVVVGCEQQTGQSLPEGKRRHQHQSQKLFHQLFAGMSCCVKLAYGSMQRSVAGIVKLCPAQMAAKLL